MLRHRKQKKEQIWESEDSKPSVDSEEVAFVTKRPSLRNRSEFDTANSKRFQNTNKKVTVTKSKYDLQHSIFVTVNARPSHKIATQ